MNTKKKILILVTQSEFGGAQRFIYRLIRGFSQKSVEFIVGAGPDGDDEKGLLAALEKEGVETEHLCHLKRSLHPLDDLFLGPIEIYRLIKRHKPDILVLCSSKAGVMGSMAGRWAKVPKIIYRIGGWTFNDPWPAWKKKIYVRIEKLTASFKDTIVNNAEADRMQAIEFGIKPKDGIVTISNGVQVDSFNFLSREEARKELGLDDSFISGTIASLYPTKGLQYLVEAANAIKNRNYKFVIIGQGQEEKKLKKLVDQFCLNERFLFIEPTYTDYRFLKAFDVFVLPSVKEGFPWTILEAMAAGVPVVATQVGAIPEIINQRINGITVEPRNSQQIAKAIKELSQDECLRKNLVKEGIRTVVEKYSSERMIKQYEGLFFTGFH